MESRPSQRPTIPGEVLVASVPHKLRPHFLHQIGGEGGAARYTLQKDVIEVGRGSGVDIPLPSDKVSRRHAVIRRKNEEYTVYDLESLHGVLLNGIRVHSAVLRDEDIVQFADMVFVYREG